MGSMIFIHPGQLHKWRGDMSGLDLIVISFKPELLSPTEIYSLPYLATTAVTSSAMRLAKAFHMLIKRSNVPLMIELSNAFHPETYPYDSKLPPHLSNPIGRKFAPESTAHVVA